MGVQRRRECDELGLVNAARGKPLRQITPVAIVRQAFASEQLAHPCSTSKAYVGDQRAPTHRSFARRRCLQSRAEPISRVEQLPHPCSLAKAYVGDRRSPTHRSPIVTLWQVPFVELVEKEAVAMASAYLHCARGHPRSAEELYQGIKLGERHPAHKGVLVLYSVYTPHIAAPGSPSTINTRRKATGGLPDRQTPFDPHILSCKPSKPLRMPWNLAIKLAPK